MLCGDLNETARSYKLLFEKLSKVDGVTFTWFTDGKGWNTAKNNLRETFYSADNIYNILEMKNGIIEELTK